MPTERDELKPCPECGNDREPKLRVRVNYHTHWYECVRCGYSPKGIGKDIDDAKRIWNERIEK